MDNMTERKALIENIETKPRVIEMLQKRVDVLTARVDLMIDEFRVRVAELEETNTVLMTRNSELFNRCVEKQKEITAANEEMDSWFRKCGLAELELAAAKEEIKRLKSKTICAEPEPDPEPEKLRGGDIKSGGGGVLWVFDDGKVDYRRTMLKGEMPTGPVLFNINEIAAAVQGGEKIVTLTDRSMQMLLEHYKFLPTDKIWDDGERSGVAKLRNAMER
jgi:hypothetical protein